MRPPVDGWWPMVLLSPIAAHDTGDKPRVPKLGCRLELEPMFAAAMPLAAAGLIHTASVGVDLGAPSLIGAFALFDGSDARSRRD